MKVSVLVMTYNHANFIRQALDSVLMQRVSFPYEIIITEDFSSDGTREIIIEYQNNYPEIIRLSLSEKNLHSNEVVARGIETAQGQFIALLDGDDYWTSPYKLQKQVDFLDSHPECAICFHNALVISEDESREPWNWTPTDQKEFSTFDDIWMGNFIATGSTMFRRGLFGQVPEWYYSLRPMITDWPLHILNAEHGKIGYINETMSVYRYHSGGLYSSLSQDQKLEWTAEFYKVMNANLNFRYDEIIRAAIFKYFWEWALEYEQRGDLDRAKSCFSKCLYEHRNNFTSLVKLFRLWLSLYIKHPISVMLLK